MAMKETDEAFEIYQPIAVTASCLECHDDLKAGAVGGVGVLRVSTKALETAKTDWNRATARIQDSDTVVAGVATMIEGDHADVAETAALLSPETGCPRPRPNALPPLKTKTPPPPAIPRWREKTVTTLSCQTTAPAGRRDDDDFPQT